MQTEDRRPSFPSWKARRQQEHMRIRAYQSVSERITQYHACVALVLWRGDLRLGGQRNSVSHVVYQTVSRVRYLDLGITRIT